MLPDIAGVVRGWGLLGPETCGVPARPQPGSESHHRFQAPGKQGFCGSPPPLGGGTDFCLAEPLPTIGQGLRANHRERQGVGAMGCGAALGPPPRAARKCLCNNGLNGLAKVLIQTLRQGGSRVYRRARHRGERQRRDGSPDRGRGHDAGPAARSPDATATRRSPATA